MLVGRAVRMTACRLAHAIDPADQRTCLILNNDHGGLKTMVSLNCNPKYIDDLLTILEGNLRYRQAFGFAGGDAPGITSGGKSNIQMCRGIALELFFKA